jgi:hypothetical protein
MAVVKREELESVVTSLGPQILHDKIKTAIQICWLLQPKEARTPNNVRDVLIKMLESEIANVDLLTKELELPD